MGWQHGNEIQAEATLQIHPWGCSGSEASRGAEWGSRSPGRGEGAAKLIHIRAERGREQPCHPTGADSRAKPELLGWAGVSQPGGMCGRQTVRRKGDSPGIGVSTTELPGKVKAAELGASIGTGWEDCPQIASPGAFRAGLGTGWQGLLG